MPDAPAAPQVVYQGNPQKEWLDLSALVEFPNLQLESTKVDFGAALVDTQQRRAVALTNPGLAHVEYSWSWAQAEPEEGEPPAACRPPSGRRLPPVIPHAAVHAVQRIPPKNADATRSAACPALQAR